MSQSKITLFFGIFIVLVFSACDLRQTKALKEHGIETEATVMRKDVSVAVRVNNRHHFLNVGFFAESGPKKDDHSVNVLADTTLTMAERLDKWQPNGAGGFK